MTDINGQLYTYSARVSEKLNQEIKQIMVINGFTKSEFIRTCIREYIERNSFAKQKKRIGCEERWH